MNREANRDRSFTYTFNWLRMMDVTMRKPVVRIENVIKSTEGQEGLRRELEEKMLVSLENF